MKHLVFLLSLMLFALTPAKAQNDITPDMLNDAYCHQLDSAAKECFLSKDYDNALLFKWRETEILKRMYGESDSTYIASLGFLPRVYLRLGQKEKAVSVTRQAIDLWGKYVSTQDDTYAIFLDNLAYYYANLGQNKKALEYSLQSLGVYEALLRNDHDMASILLHCAEYSWADGKINAAIKYELRSLAILKDLYGELSDEYIDELPYLQRFYEDAGDRDNAKKIEDKIAELKEKKSHRFDIDGIATPEGCRQHNREALICAMYYLDHPADDAQIPAIERYISKWAITSPDVNIVVDESITILLVADQEKAAPYISAYVAAYVEYALKHNVKDVDDNGKKAIFARFINYYAANRDITGRIDLLEKYVSE